MRVCIVEDDPIINEFLCAKILALGYEVSGQYYNDRTAHQEFRRVNHDLCLMDIELGGNKDGIQLAQSIKFATTPIIYITSFIDQSFMLRANAPNTLAYITKPLKESDLEAALILANFKLLKNPIIAKNHDANIFMKSEGNLVRLDKSTILFVEAFDNYCYVQCKDKRHLVSYTLKAAEEKLQDPTFFRIHRSILVNMNKITTIGNNFVYVNDHQLKLSANRRTDLLDRLVIL